MSIAAVEEKFRELPEAYVVLVNDYVDSLLERAKKCRTCRVSYLFLGIDTIKLLTNKSYRLCSLEVSKKKDKILLATFSLCGKPHIETKDSSFIFSLEVFEILLLIFQTFLPPSRPSAGVHITMGCTAQALSLCRL